MGKKDIITKEYMEDTEVFADVFNHMIYKGEKIIDPKNLKELDTTNVVIPYGADGADVPYQKYRDVFTIRWNMRHRYRKQSLRIKKRGRRKILRRRNQIPESFFRAFTEKTGCFRL